MKRSLLGFLLLIWSASAFSQNTALVIDSDLGEPIGKGLSYYFTPADGEFNASRNFENEVSVQFSNGSASWTVEFAAPESDTLEVKTYLNAAQYPFSGTQPGLSVSGNFVACGKLAGEFEVKEIAFGPDDTITAFHATFVQYCDGYLPALRGEILYYSSDSLPPKLHLTSPLSAFATRNHLFQYLIRASNEPTTFSATNLPAGLSLNASTGVISGTPSGQGTFSIPLTATGSGGVAVGTLVLTVDPADQSTGPYSALFITSDPGDYVSQGRTYFFEPFDGAFRVPPGDIFNSVYTDFLGAPDYAADWSVDFAAPINATIGIGQYFDAGYFTLTDYPALAIIGEGRRCFSDSVGTFEVKELAYNGEALSSFRATFENRCAGVEPALYGEVWINSSNAITSAPFATVLRDQPFSFQLIGNNKPTSYTARALPPGLVFNGSTGLISGNPTAGGLFSIPLTATGPTTTATDRLTLEVTTPNGDSAPLLTGRRQIAATIQQPFSYQIVATGSPTLYAASGLPAGLAIDPNSGLISGTPTVAGDFDLILSADNGSGTGARSLTFSVYPPPPVVTSPSQLSVDGGKPSSFQVTANNAPASFSASGLPYPLRLDSISGQVTGTIDRLGTFPLTIRAWNGSGVSSQAATLTVRLTVPEITSPLVASGMENLPFEYEITAIGLPSVVTAEGLPDDLFLSSSSGLIEGIPQTAGTYQVTLKASNAAGSTSANLVLTIARGASRLLNLSTRLAVGTDDDVLIGGFIVTGSLPKTVLIRGIGPSLADAGVPGALADPVLELHDAGGAILASNDNWRETQEFRIMETTAPPSDDLEAAIVFTLPGDGAGYTAILKGKDGGTGIGLVEVYDLDQVAYSLVANISTRGFVATGDDVMVGGFIVGDGSADGTVVVRALGPSLSSSGIDGALPDPVLDLHDAYGSTIASNDDWKDAQQEQIEAIGLALRDDREAAIVATLPIGAYTAIVRDQAGTSGVAVFELYQIP